MKPYRRHINGELVESVCGRVFPAFRIDHKSYGGVKDSGMGSESLRHDLEDMTERKTLMVNPV